MSNQPMSSLSNAELAAADPDVWVEVDGELIPNYDATLSDFDEGDVVTGQVVRIDKDEVLIDIGYKSEGVIPVNELSIRRSVNPGDEVALGDEVDALVLQKEDADGRLILSKKRARFEKAWKKIEAAAESGEPVDGQVIEVVKGGLIIDLGVRGFLPASLVDIRRVQDLEEFRGETLRCKVIELNRSRNNVVLSRRAVLEEERREVRQRILDDLEPGAVVEGVISNIVDFGAFVDLEGIDGLIHISELSWTHVNHPSEILEIGQTVKVKVLDIDRDRQRISLGLKQTQADPWQRVLESYQQGDNVHGRVTKVVTFGAFVEILQGVEGLVHISELAAHHVENPREVVAPGQHVVVKIIDIDADRRRLSLSMKRVSEHEPLLPPIALVPGDKPFLADEIAAEESGVPLPSLVSDSDAVFSDELTPEDQAALEFYAASASSAVAEPGTEAEVEAEVAEAEIEAEVAEAEIEAEVAEAEAEVAEDEAPVEDAAPVASAETDEPAGEAEPAEAVEDAGEVE
jgi:small subunit ribosomal protein S1